MRRWPKCRLYRIDITEPKRPDHRASRFKLKTKTGNRQVSIYYTKDHEYIRVEGDVGIVGISNYAQEQLGDIVYVELPDVGKNFEAGDEAAVVESVKAASEIYSPIGGEVVETNEDLNDNPALINETPEDGAWFIKLKISDKDELEKLMSGDEYSSYTEGLS